MKVEKKRRVLLILHLFVSVGALVGGLAAIIDPVQPLGMPKELLEGSPFNNYLIPGLILFVIIGLGHLFSGLSVMLRLRYQGYISSISSWALMIFIVVQCIMIRMIVFPHILYFSFGLAGALMAYRLLSEENLFPTNIVLRFVKRK